jgi:hypothetical protein
LTLYNALEYNRVYGKYTTKQKRFITSHDPISRWVRISCAFFLRSTKHTYANNLVEVYAKIPSQLSWQSPSGRRKPSPSPSRCPVYSNIKSKITIKLWKIKIIAVGYQVVKKLDQ